jgi:hypothetical protein
METKNLYQINDIGSYCSNLKKSTYFKMIHGKYQILPDVILPIAFVSHALNGRFG